MPGRPGMLTEPPRPVVVVTGPPRSGTTVMGQLLGYAHDTFVVHEPFNQDWGLYGLPRKFPYLRGEVDAGATEAVLLHGYLSTGRATWRNPDGLIPDSGSRAVERRELVQRHPGWTAVVKDPFMMCALGWSGEVLSRRPAIVTLRHPAAWAASMMRRKMSPRPILRGLAAQPELGDGALREVLTPWLEGKVRNTLELLGTAWSALVLMLDTQLADGAPAEVVRMEDFAADPITTVRHLYDVLGLLAPGDLDAKVRRHTEADTVIPDPSVMHELHRNSAALANAWQSIMTEAQRRKIRNVCEPYAGGRYTDW